MEPSPLSPALTESDFAGLIERLREGDDQAVDAFFVRYFAQLARTADYLLPKNLAKMADGEDLAQSVMRTFFRRVREGQFPDLSDEGRLRALLKTLLQRRLKNYIKHELAGKRDQRRSESDSSVDSFASGIAGIANIAANEEVWIPRDQEILAEEIAAALSVLESDRQRQIAEMVLGGESPAVITEKLDIHPVTYHRHFNRILALWTNMNEI